MAKVTPDSLYNSPMTIDDTQPPILITGATGFLGGRLARTLLAEGIPVRVTGRNLRTGQELARAGADFRPVDLRDRSAMLAVCQGVGAVVHSGALSSAWGAYRDFFGINVGGTQNVIDGCLAHGVKRLVHISSPSVMTRPEPQLGLRESDPLPDTFVSMYSETKKLAEDRVNAAIAAGMNAVILRPKAIYGPGDNAIIPRLLEAAAKKRLPVIGDGTTITDMTHVDDVIRAIRLALEKDVALGHTYCITGNKDVRIWDLVKDLLDRLGYDPPARTFSLRKAMRIARILEGLWRALPLPGEPPLTTYKVGILGISQTYDTAAAERDLGYAPKITLEAGMQSVIDAFQAPKETGRPAPETTAAAGDPTPLKVTILKAGDTAAREKLFRPGGGWHKIAIPALFALIEHPDRGPIVWDTGYARRFFDGTRQFPFRLMSALTPVRVDEKDEAAHQVAARGFPPENVPYILLSHFDPDHYGGLKDFPNARIICTAEAWEAVRDKTGWAAFHVRLLPGHLPEDIAARLWILPPFEGPAIGPFPRSHDLFGDGAIRLVEVPGHAAGQMAAFVRTGAGKELLLAADACWNVAAINAQGYRGGVHRILAVDKAGHDATYAKLRALRAFRPEVIIVPSHCPETWARLSPEEADTI